MTKLDTPRNPLAAYGRQRSLSATLRNAIAALADRANVCNLVSIRDLADALPPRALTDNEIHALMAALADHGLYLIEPDAADLLAKRGQA